MFSYADKKVFFDLSTPVLGKERLFLVWLKLEINTILKLSEWPLIFDKIYPEF